MPLRLVTVLALMLLALPVTAQGWCASSNLNATELAICTDPILGDLDAEMTALYQQNKLSDQRDWLRARNACEGNIFCIEDAYRSRIAVMRAALTSPPVLQLRPWCRSGRLNLTEQTICNTVLLANLDAALQATYGAARAQGNDPEQVNWLRGRRDACGADLRCIRQAYVQRLIELGERLRLEGK